MGGFQWNALPFCPHVPPYWTGRLAQIVEKTLLPGDPPDLVRGRHSHCVRKSGILFYEARCSSSNKKRFRFNCEKIPSLRPSQQVNYHGQQINLRSRTVGPHPAKLGKGLEMTKACQRRRRSTPANIAGVAEKVLCFQKGNVALHALVKRIMREAACLLHGGVCWRTYTPYSHKPIWQPEEALEALKHPGRTPFHNPPPSTG